MKKHFSIAGVIAIIALLTAYTGCKKKDSLDTTKPVVTLNGLATCYLQKGTPYVDAEATALDNVDGTLPVNSTGGPNINIIGMYTETYTATDKAGNSGTATRTIYVVDITGNYNVVRKTPYPVVVSTTTTNYPDGLSLLNNMSGQIYHSNFDNYPTIYLNSFLTSGNSINLPAQTLYCGIPAINRTFSGSGAITMLHGSVRDTTEIIFNFTETDSTFVLRSQAVYKKIN